MLKVQKNISLKEHNTLGVASEARYFVEVSDVDALQEACSFVREHDIELLILGGGSNVCLPETLDKLVVSMCIRSIEEKEGEVIVGAGEEWNSFVQRGIELGVPYIENLAGIPGTVGASPIQNIGAYGVEVKDMIAWVEVWNTEAQEIERLPNEACQFGYRDSVFKKDEGTKYIVTRVAFQINKDAPTRLGYKDLQEHFGDTVPTKEEIRKAVLEIRSGKFPGMKEWGTAGSFFKNPIISKEQFKTISTMHSTIPSYLIDEEYVKVPLAWILDHVCDLKGYTEGNVGLYEKQPLILVTNKQATGKEIQNFSEKIQNIVFEKTGIEIENEVTFV